MQQITQNKDDFAAPLCNRRSRIKSGWLEFSPIDRFLALLVSDQSGRLDTIVRGKTKLGGPKDNELWGEGDSDRNSSIQTLARLGCEALTVRAALQNESH